METFYLYLFSILDILGQSYDYFCEGKWTDSEGKPVKNWKQKALTWDSKERQRRTIAAARGLIPQKSGVVSATYGKDIPL